MKIIKLITYLLTPFIKVKTFFKNINITIDDIHKDYEIINLNGEEIILGKKHRPYWY